MKPLQQLFGLALEQIWKYQNKHSAIKTFKKEMSSLEKDGMIDGELLHFELWQSSTNHLYNLEIEWKEGGDLYSSNGINIASLIVSHK